MNWDTFTTVFLWQFKPEWRVILPLPDDDENPISESSTPYLDSLVANLPAIADDIDKSTIDNVQGNEEIPRADEFMVQSESKFMVNTIGDCIGKIVESPLNKAL
ncbi:hypothetical protein A2U01_0062963, partial [Trifolium medium]|nr:hypothetical protein [Trifolium medium]